MANNMKRLFPRALLLTAVCLVAAKPNDRPPSLEADKPSTEPSEPTSFHPSKFKALADQRMEMYAGRCYEMLPEERDAVRRPARSLAEGVFGTTRSWLSQVALMRCGNRRRD